MIQQILVNKNVDTVGEIFQAKFLEFLETFRVSRAASSYINYGDDEENAKEEDEYELTYIKQAQNIRTLNRSTMFVDLDHFYEWDRTYEYRDPLVTQTFRLQPYLNNAVTELMKKHYFEWAKKRCFFVAFYNCTDKNILRDLKTNKIGKLITISGTITRTSEIKPELLTGVFSCKMCNSITKNVEQQFRYTEPKLCSNTNCQNRTKWTLIKEDSVYCDWQKLKVQENPSDIPAGSMPRSIDVIIRNELTELCKPGDKCEISGCLQVVPDTTVLLKPGEKAQHQLKREAVRKEDQKSLDGVTGLKNLGIRDLTYKLVFIAQSVNFPDINLNPIKQLNAPEKRAGQEVNSFHEEELKKILQMRNEQGIYSKLAKCIAGGIYGHDDVKKGILLMLFGGVNKTTDNGMKLRGDINVCIVGDPSTAKSNFLKYVNQLLPRSVYTSGKGSSAAGLTASVLRDVETGEFCIEAGALMLADNSICCIDEFDKMDAKDQVAIHEAMEQQTISIAKAGIQATLMSRTSILAAANPVYGRYDKTKSLKNNIDMSAPIMSRFDLFFVVVDDKDDFLDYQIAQHIVNMHHKYHEDLNSMQVDSELSNEISQKDFLLYLRFAKNLNPKFTKEAAEQLKQEYLLLRQGDITAQKTSYRITVRQLESLVRLSEALARVHMDEFIHPTYVTEAAKLLKKSIIPVEMPSIELENEFESRLQEDRKRHEENQDVVMMDAEKTDKIFMAGADYEKWKTRIVLLINEFENNDAKVKHSDIINYLCEENFPNLENTREASELVTKLNAIIERLINKDGVLIVTNDSDDKLQRVLSVNVNFVPVL